MLAVSLANRREQEALLLVTACSIKAMYNQNFGQMNKSSSSRLTPKRESSAESLQTTASTVVGSGGAGNSSLLGMSEIKPLYHAPESVYNLETVYKNNTRFATQSVLPPNDYHSPYYIPFKNIDDPRPVDQLIYRFSIWKMIIKQVIFYFKEMSMFKSQTYQGNRAMLENLEILKRQNSGKLKVKANANKSLKKSLSSTSFGDMYNNATGGGNIGGGGGMNGSSTNLSHGANVNFNPSFSGGGGGAGGGNGASSIMSGSTAGASSISLDNLENEMNMDQQNMVNKLLQTTFLPAGDNSILSISSTFFNNHNYLKEKELLTYQHLTNRLIPRLENLKDQLNETIKQMNSIKNSSDYKTKNLKMEIAKTGGIMSDYITSIELLRTGHSKSSLGTTIELKNNRIDSKMDPYILKLRLDLQLKDQLYIEAHLKEMYYDLQYKAVQLEKILYTEIQNCISTYTDLIDSELNAVKDNMIMPFKDGFVKNDPTIDWDYFIKNDCKRNFLPINAKNTILKVKKVRKNSDIVYPYRNSVISSCIYSGYLDRKSKYLKNYSKFFYVLTINFLHEFRSNDRIKDLNPTQSFSLTDVTVSAVDDDPKKFVIRVYKKGDKETKTKFTFKADNIDSAIKWIDYLSDLTEFENTIERNISYDASDDENGYDDHNPSAGIPTSVEQNNFADNNSTVSSPASNSYEFNQRPTDALSSPESPSLVSHSRSISDELFPKSSQYQQVQNSLQDVDYFSKTHNNNTNNLGNVTFKSIKSQPNMRQTSSSSISLGNSNSKASSRTSSRASSRASSPARSRNNRPLLSPKIVSSNITPTSGNSTASGGGNGGGGGSGGGDYFSYAPRKVQASIIRNGNRLASTNNNGRLTPGTNNNSALTLNVAMAKNLSSSSVNDKLNASVPKINIHDSTPVNTEKPNINSILDGNYESPPTASSQPISNEPNEEPKNKGLERRRKTLSEKLDITGLVSANKIKNNGLLKLSNDAESLNSTAGLPQTPGIIPGSMMNEVFDTSNNIYSHASSPPETISASSPPPPPPPS